MLVDRLRPLAFLLVLASGCAKKGPPPIDPEAERKSLEPIAAELDAAVPPSLKGKLSFETGFMREKTAAFVRPKGWKEAFEGNYNGADGLGFMTSFWASSNCDGMCSPKDWEATTNQVDFAQFSEKPGQYKIDKDEKSEGLRVVVARSEQTNIVVAMWKPGASRYFVCRATLDKEATEAAAVFEKACRAMKPLDWG